MGKSIELWVARDELGAQHHIYFNKPVTNGNHWADYGEIAHGHFLTVTPGAMSKVFKAFFNLKPGEGPVRVELRRVEEEG